MTHGGVLAAVGHLLSDSFGHLVISSSISKDRDKPWGSHWRIDENWSSSNLRITHFGAEHQRNEKLIMIANEPLVRSNLRVCWENRSSSGNCSICEKCIRTRVALMMAGELENYPGFEGAENLVEQIANLPLSTGKMLIFSKALDSERISPEIKSGSQSLASERPRDIKTRITSVLIAPVVRLKSWIFGLTR